MCKIVAEAITSAGVYMDPERFMISYRSAEGIDLELILFL